MVYDEISKEYKPRWGYKSVTGGIDEHAIVEVKEGQDPYKDPWAEARNEKKLRVEKNQKKHAMNLLRNKEGKIIKKSYGQCIIIFHILKKYI